VGLGVLPLRSHLLRVGKGARKGVDSEFAGRNSAMRIRTEGKGGLKWLNGNTEFNESSFDLM